MIFSPFDFFVSDLAPAAAADGQGFVLVVDVEFNVAVGALSVPRISTGLSHRSNTSPNPWVLLLQFKGVYASTKHGVGRLK